MVNGQWLATEDVYESLCPYCLRRIPARRIAEGNDVYLHRTCPEHGDIEKVLIWRNDRVLFAVWTKPRTGTCCSSSCNCNETPTEALDDATDTNCPYECGICQNHRQRTCSAIIEVTARCNLRCPVCFADVPEKCAPDPDIDQIERILKNVMLRAGNSPIQLSGGEPTLRDDLPEILRRARALGFDHIQVNTNGLRIAEDFAYAKTLREAGVTDFFLQFDGVDDGVYRKIRGRELFSLKEAAIQTAADLRTAVILVPTLVKGVNDEQIGAIIEFAKRWMPTVKGVHFQPMTYLGRYPRSPRNEDRVIVPDILSAIEAQTRGEFTVENFIPSACEDPRCSFSALAVLNENERLVPATHIDWASTRGTDAAEKSIAYVRRHWKYPSSGKTKINSSTESSGTPEVSITPKIPTDPVLERIRNYSLCISGMAFQDVWNIEIGRLQRCCVHVAVTDSRLVPFCAYYLTGANGQRFQEEVCVMDVKKIIQEKYGFVALQVVEKGTNGSCCDGLSCCSTNDPITGDLYDVLEKESLPDAAVLASLGCGNPTALAELKLGEIVLDLGSGGGIDVFLSAKRVGPTGKAYGLDMTDEMLALARKNQEKAGVTNVEFIKGEIENIPLPDNSVDVIISNCVINLSGDKDRVLREAFRVLKPGGRFAVADIVTRGGVPEEIRKSVLMWAGCVAGALEETEYCEKLAAAGFTNIDIESTRVYRAKDILRFLERKGGNCATLHTEVEGKFVSAFIRAVKP